MEQQQAQCEANIGKAEPMYDIKLSVLVPTYNEGENVEPLIAELRQVLQNVDNDDFAFFPLFWLKSGGGSSSNCIISLQ